MTPKQANRRHAQLYRAVSEAETRLTRWLTATFCPGTRVRFLGRHGRWYSGEVVYSVGGHGRICVRNNATGKEQWIFHTNVELAPE